MDWIVGNITIEIFLICLQATLQMNDSIESINDNDDDDITDPDWVETSKSKRNKVNVYFSPFSRSNQSNVLSLFISVQIHNIQMRMKQSTKQLQSQPRHRQSDQNRRELDADAKPAAIHFADVANMAGLATIRVDAWHWRIVQMLSGMKVREA